MSNGSGVPVMSDYMDGLYYKCQKEVAEVSYQPDSTQLDEAEVLKR